LSQARAILTGLHRQPAVAEVAAITVDFANARYQVVQVGFGSLITRVVACAVLAPARLPALTLVTEFPRRDNVKCAL
jgi:hypothetical protein